MTTAGILIKGIDRNAIRFSCDILESWLRVAENFKRWPNFEYFNTLNLNERSNATMVTVMDAHLLSCFSQVLNFLSFLVILI